MFFVFKTTHLPFYQTQRGAFESPLVLKVFALHQDLTIKVPLSYGSPIGGLALCAAVVCYDSLTSINSHMSQVERELELWKEGVNAAQAASADVGTSKKSRRSPQYEFGNEKWGRVTKNYTKSTVMLTEERWTTICQAAFEYSEENEEELHEVLVARGAGLDFVDPRAAIVLDD